VSNLLEPVDALRRINAWVALNHPNRLPFVRMGARSDTIQRFERRLGRKLPPCLRQLYAAHDGQPEGAISLLLNQRWLPLDLVVVAWEDLCFRYGCNEDGASDDDARCLATLVWSATWLPLFGSPRGDHYCVELSADRPDRHGRIIWFLYDEPDRPVVAPSISELLSRIARGLDTGRWQLDEVYDGLCD